MEIVDKTPRKPADLIGDGDVVKTVTGDYYLCHFVIRDKSKCVVKSLKSTTVKGIYDNVDICISNRKLSPAIFETQIGSKIEKIYPAKKYLLAIEPIDPHSGKFREEVDKYHKEGAEVQGILNSLEYAGYDYFLTPPATKEDNIRYFIIGRDGSKFQLVKRSK